MEVSRDGRPAEYKVAKKTARRSQQLQGQRVRSLAVRVISRLHDTTGCRYGYTTGLTTGCIQYDTAVCQTGCQTGLTTGLTTGCIV